MESANQIEFVEIEANNVSHETFDREEDFLVQYDHETDGARMNASYDDENGDFMLEQSYDEEFLLYDQSDDENDSSRLSDGTESPETVKCEFIINERGHKKLYVNDFGFHRRKTEGMSTRWRCEFQQNFCAASATTIELSDGTSRIARLNDVHNHLVDLSRKQKFIGRHSMKLEALQNSTTAPITICQEALSANVGLGSSFGTTKQLREVVGYARRTKLHPFPAIDVNNIFFELDGLFAKVNEKSMVLADWQDTEHQQRILILGTQNLFKQLCASSLWIVDLTFRSCPRPFQQLMTIFGNNVSGDEYTSYGMIYVLVCGKSLSVYQQVFRLVAEIAQQFTYRIKLEYFLSDFELAIGKAAVLQFPDVATFFCYFHFVQSMIKRVKKMGLWEKFREPQVRRWVELIFVMPLLPPADIPAAFDAVMLHNDFPDDLNELFMWFGQNYFGSRFEVVKWSVNFLLTHGYPKSQNFVESSHRKLNQILRVKQPKFYQVLNQL